MGFMNFMGKMIAGKPVFEVPPEENQTSSQAADVSATSSADEPTEHIDGGERIGPDGKKVIAEAEVVQIENHYSGENLEIWARIRNNSSFRVFLDKIDFLGLKTELDRDLQPGEEWEYKIWRGKMLDNDNYPNAELYYRDNESGDYFLAYHQIHYGSPDGKHYEVQRLQIIRPVKDI